jgi:HSP20 family molecular chaperone IbpA
MSLATLFQEVEQAFRPNGITLFEKEDAFVLEALTAGVKPKDINITIEKGAVYIDAKTGSYNYSYLAPLPPGQIDESATPEAISEDGILKITFPKVKVSRPLKISVKNG